MSFVGDLIRIQDKKVDRVAAFRLLKLESIITSIVLLVMLARAIINKYGDTVDSLSRLWIAVVIPIAYYIIIPRLVVKSRIFGVIYGVLVSIIWGAAFFMGLSFVDEYWFSIHIVVRIVIAAGIFAWSIRDHLITAKVGVKTTEEAEMQSRKDIEQAIRQTNAVVNTQGETGFVNNQRMTQGMTQGMYAGSGGQAGRFCPFCGKPVERGVFCSYCGKKLNN